MKVTGIIAEYNPFHSGHHFHIEEAKRLTGAHWCVAVMSGDFVQRGEPAVYSKYLRTRMALTCGADLVVELPSAFAVSSAEDFAACGVALLTGLGAVDTLCFGSEDGDIQKIQTAAGLLAGEKGEFSSHLSRGLRQGLSWPQARNEALVAMAEDDPAFPLARDEMNRLLGSPNNLLGIEYCKAILRQDSPLTPVTVRRTGLGYHDEGLTGGQASASAIRRVLKSDSPAPADPSVSAGALVSTAPPAPAASPALIPSAILPHIPAALLPLYGKEPPLGANDMSGLLNFRLLEMERMGQDFSLYADVSAEMAQRLENHLLLYEDWEGRVGQLKTRQYTYTRISRALLHMVLGLTDDRIREYRAAGRAPYARILGFRRDSAQLLSLIKQKTSIPLVTKTADVRRVLTGTALDMCLQDIHASHIRQTVQAGKQGQSLRNEYNQPLCIL